jgi:DNA polymerase III sliding clamp (beta) subunit (PCNA family)
MVGLCIIETVLLRRFVELIIDAGGISEGNIVFSKEGMMCRAISPDHICFVEAVVAKKQLNKLIAREEQIVPIELPRLKDVLKTVRSDLVQLDLEKKTGTLKVSGGLSGFNIGLLGDLQVVTDEMLPQLDFPSSCNVNPSDVLQGLAGAELVSDQAIITHDEDGLTVTSRGQKDRSSLTIPEANMTDGILGEGESFASTYDIKLLKSGLKLADESVKLSIGKDMPVQFDYTFGGSLGTARFLQAPRVDND